LHDCQISHGDLRNKEITIDDGTARFGLGSASAAPPTTAAGRRRPSLVTTSELYAEAAVGAAVDVFGKERGPDGVRRLTRSAMPSRIPQVGGRRRRRDVRHPRRSEATDRGRSDQGRDDHPVHRNQVIQLVLLVALVYVAYPFIATSARVLSELRTANWWWALLRLTVSALTYIGAAASLWACADGLVSFRNLVIMQVANTFAATTTPAGVGGLALSTRFLQKGGLGALRATAAVALQQTVQVITHVALLIFFSFAAGASADLSHFVPRQRCCI
jgi:hypothetical protein